MSVNATRISVKDGGILSMIDNHTPGSRRFTHVCLDLDGTLADSIPAMKAAYARFLARFKKNGSESEFDELNGPTLREIVGILNTRHNLSACADDLLAAYTQDIAAAYRDTVAPMPGAAQLLNDLCALGYELILVTANVREIAAEFIAAQQWDRFFSASVFGADVPRAKPEPDIYRVALERCGARPEHTAAVEDSSNGIRAAAAAGLFAIGLAPGGEHGNLRGAGAMAVISTLSELPGLLNSINQEMT